ncbi:hypothetical protein E2542_SST20943 [Spatholobus suberectus]|nr:hypothetical protein E2542_SST20943 [Spatholobus suberectus]
MHGDGVEGLRENGGTNEALVKATAVEGRLGRVQYGTMGPPIPVLKRSTRVQGSHVNGTIHYRGFFFFDHPTTATRQLLIAVEDLCIDSTTFCCIFPAMDRALFQFRVRRG